MEIVEARRKPQSESVLPLVNIVFLLLIFFMLAGAFNKPDLFNIVAPKTEVTARADQAPLIITMSKAAKLAIGTRIYTREALLERLKQHIEENKVSSVQLKADENVKSSDLIEFMQLLASTGLDSVKLLALEK